MIFLKNLCFFLNYLDIIKSSDKIYLKIFYTALKMIKIE